jgi:hypothetical protein
MSIGQAWQQEQPYFHPLPKRPFDCCVTRQVTLSPYSQVTYETNRYSVPVEKARRTLVRHPPIPFALRSGTPWN